MYSKQLRLPAMPAILMALILIAGVRYINSVNAGGNVFSATFSSSPSTTTHGGCPVYKVAFPGDFSSMGMSSAMRPLFFTRWVSLPDKACLARS